MELYLKMKGTGEAYKKVPYETIMDPRYVPRFEHNIKWTQRTSGPPRRKLVAHDESSNRMDTDVQQGKITRKRSMDQQGLEDKIARLNADSSSSTGSPDTDNELTVYHNVKYISTQN